MPYCPKCDLRITELNEYTKGEEKHRFYVGTDGVIESEYIDWIDGDGNNVEFECPECIEVIFDSYTESEKFLKRVVCDKCRLEIKGNAIKETMKEVCYYFCSETCQDDFRAKVISEIL